MTVTRQPRDEAVLHRAALPLAPDRMPYYVATTSQPGHGIGWFWLPAGADEPQLLGSNVYMAQAFLMHAAGAP